MAKQQRLRIREEEDGLWHIERPDPIFLGLLWRLVAIARSHDEAVEKAKKIRAAYDRGLVCEEF